MWTYVLQQCRCTHALITQLTLELHLLSIFGGTDNGYRLIQHDLVRAVCMEVHARHKGSLGWMCLKEEEREGGGNRRRGREEKVGR